MRWLFNFLALFNLFLAFSPAGYSQGSSTGSGGGNDIVRIFQEDGYEAIEWAKHSPELLERLPQKEKTLFLLQSFLSIRFIQVVNSPHGLYDRFSSKAQALGVPGKIVLDEKLWYERIRDHLDLHKDIFHELLRAANLKGDLDDDDWKISKFLRNPYEQKHGLKKFDYGLLGLTDDQSVLKMANSNFLYLIRPRMDIPLLAKATTFYLDHGVLYPHEGNSPRVCKFQVSDSSKYTRVIRAYTPFSIIGISNLAAPLYDSLGITDNVAQIQFMLKTEAGSEATLTCNFFNLKISIGILKEQLGTIFDLVGAHEIDFE